MKPAPVRIHRRRRRPGGARVRRRSIVLRLFAASRQSGPCRQRPTLTGFGPHSHSLIDLPQAAHPCNPRARPSGRPQGFGRRWAAAWDQEGPHPHSTSIETNAPPPVSLAPLDRLRQQRQCPGHCTRDTGPRFQSIQRKNHRADPTRRIPATAAG